MARPFWFLDLERSILCVLAYSGDKEDQKDSQDRPNHTEPCVFYTAHKLDMNG